nr:hypothetical protein BaRGS_011581 [Batillaria attramentaria]
MIVVFTRWDEMEEYFPTPESFIHERTDKLKALLEDVDGRYVMVNNKADWPDRIQQSKRLVAEVKKLVEKSGGVFRWPSEDLIKRVFFELSTKMGAGWRDFISFLPGWSSRERLLAVIDQAREDEKLPARNLRSASSLRLRLPSSDDTSKKRHGARSFKNAAPKLWDSLTETVKEAVSITAFRKRLKTHLFNASR